MPSIIRNKLRVSINKKQNILKSKATTNIIPKLTFEDKKWLTELYAEDVKKLKAITNLNFQEWSEFNAIK